jgi:hypothetical protein
MSQREGCQPARHAGYSVEVLTRTRLLLRRRDEAF